MECSCLTELSGFLNERTMYGCGELDPKRVSSIEWSVCHVCTTWIGLYVMSVSYYSRRGVWRSCMNGLLFQRTKLLCTYTGMRICSLCGWLMMTFSFAQVFRRGFLSIFVGFPHLFVRTFPFLYMYFPYSSFSLPCRYHDGFCFVHAYARAYAHAGFLCGFHSFFIYTPL